MAKKNEYDLLRAIMQIGRADAGAGGLVALTEKTVPIIRWRDLNKLGNAPPIVAVLVFAAEGNRGAPEKFLCGVQLDCIVPQDEEGLESRIADRLAEAFTPAAFLDEDLDVAAFERQRRPLSGLEEGRRRLEVDYDMAMKR